MNWHRFTASRVHSAVTNGLPSRSPAIHEEKTIGAWSNGMRGWPAQRATARDRSDCARSTPTFSANDDKATPGHPAPPSTGYSLFLLARTDVGQCRVHAAEELRQAGEDGLLEVVQPTAELVLRQIERYKARRVRKGPRGGGGGDCRSRCGWMTAFWWVEARTMGEGGERRISSVRHAAWTYARMLWRSSFRS